MTTPNPKIRLLFKCIEGSLKPQYTCKKAKILLFDKLASYHIYTGNKFHTILSQKFHCSSFTYDSKSNRTDDNVEDSHVDRSTVLPEFTKSILDNATSYSEGIPSNPDDIWASSVYPNVTKKQETSKKQVDPQDRTVVMFPGQGSQKVGMGKLLLSIPNVSEMYKVASEIVGYDVLKLCIEGPQEKLDETQYSQVALLVTSLAYLEKLQQQKPEVVENCVTTMGFSVGEFAALVFAGVITFEEAVWLVHLRGEAMQAASDLVPSGMTTLFLNPEPQVNLILEAARDWAFKAGVENPICNVANNLYPSCKVVAGHLPALEFIERHTRDLRIKGAKRLPVSGAFHTALMQPAMEPWKLALKQVNFQSPIIKVHSNVDGKPHKVKTISKMLEKHLVSPVKWEQTLSSVYERPNGTNYPQTYECGPGQSLKAILKRMNMKAWESSETV